MKCVQSSKKIVKKFTRERNCIRDYNMLPLTMPFLDNVKFVLWSDGNGGNRKLSVLPIMAEQTGH